MTEPPAKRARRTDSSAMWARNDSRRSVDDDPSHHTNGASDRRDRREDRDRRYERDDRRYRSRSRDKRRDRSLSRDRASKRRDRSFSPDRDRRRDKDVGRDKIRDKRYSERSRSRDRHKSRRDKHPPRRSDHPRSRSASPRKDHTSNGTRTRTPPRPSRRTRSPSPPSKQFTDRPRPNAPPTGPRVETKPSANGTSQPTNGASEINPESKEAVEEMEIDSDPEVAAMRKAMGFTGFKTTKNTKVKGNNVSGVRREKKTEYRQYMNRVGGFNRPLSPSR